MKRLLFAFIFFSISSIFPAAKVETLLKDSSAKMASSQALLDGALVLTKDSDISFKQHGVLIAVSSDIKFAACMSDSHINLVDISTGNLLWSRSKCNAGIIVKISKDNRFVLITSEGGLNEVIDLKNGCLIHIIRTKRDEKLYFNDVYFSDDSKFLIYTDCENKRICLTDLNTKQVQFCNIPGDTFHYRGVFVASDDRVITISNPKEDVHRITITDFQGKVIKIIPIKSESKSSILLSHVSDSKFAFLYDFANIYLLDLVTGDVLTKLRMRSAFAISYDKTFVVAATGHGDCNARVIYLKSGRLRCIIKHREVIWSASISADNRFVTTVSGDCVVKITDLKPDIKDPLQINLINWIYTKKINSAINPLIVLDEKQTSIFASLNQDIQSAIFSSYSVRMHGFKPTFANALSDPNSLNVKIDDSTQSKQHILFHGINYLIQEILRDPKNKEFFLKIYAQEKVEHSNGNYVFVHGREWKWNFLSDVYKQLWKITKNDDVKNYEFLRFGVPGENRRGRDILFMNSAIFGNCYNEGSCTAHYWYANFDWSSQKHAIDVSDVFKTFKLEEVYKKHSANLKALDELHKQCSKRGEVLLISVPKNMLKYVICTQAGGGIKEVIVNGKYTSDSQTILDAVKDPKQTLSLFDNLEWGLVLGNFDNGFDNEGYTVNPDTNDPNKGISIYSFHDADEKMIHEYEKMRDEIFSKIKGDLKGKSALLIKSKL